MIAYRNKLIDVARPRALRPRLRRRHHRTGARRRPAAHADAPVGLHPGVGRRRHLRHRSRRPGHGRQSRSRADARLQAGGDAGPQRCTSSSITPRPTARPIQPKNRPSARASRTSTPCAWPTRSSGARTAPASRSSMSRGHRSIPDTQRHAAKARPSASSSPSPIPRSAARWTA